MDVFHLIFYLLKELFNSHLLNQQYLHLFLHLIIPLKLFLSSFLLFLFESYLLIILFLILLLLKDNQYSILQLITLFFLLIPSFLLLNILSFQDHFKKDFLSFLMLHILVLMIIYHSINHLIFNVIMVVFISYF